MSEVIEARGLTKIFHDRTVALKDFDLQVRRGVVYGLIGRNGSGKTTALRLLLGLLKPDRGEASVLGWDFWQAPRAIRRRVAYVSQGQNLPERASLEQLSWCLARYNERWDPGFAGEMARRWGLPWRQPLGGLSSGRQRLAAILVALASAPEVLLLDEPAAGLDPAARRELLQQIVDVLGEGGGCTVLLSTHLIGDLERIANYIGILQSGRMALSLPLEDLLQQFQRVQVVFPTDEPPADFAVPGQFSQTQSGPVFNAVVRWPNGCELEALRASVDARIQVFSMGLEEIFIELFGNEAAAEAPSRALAFAQNWT
jgi:ABC-2 type transport system ATP-binding protein